MFSCLTPGDVPLQWSKSVVQSCVFVNKLDIIGLKISSSFMSLLGGGRLFERCTEAPIFGSIQQRQGRLDIPKWSKEWSKKHNGEPKESVGQVMFMPVLGCPHLKSRARIRPIVRKHSRDCPWPGQINIYIYLYIYAANSSVLFCQIYQFCTILDSQAALCLPYMQAAEAVSPSLFTGSLRYKVRPNEQAQGLSKFATIHFMTMWSRFAHCLSILFGSIW